MILTADLHLTDRPEDSYRWRVFSEIRKIMLATKETDIYILGDITDRKDRHSALLVNKLVDELQTLPGRVTILMGNHDMPLRGTPFWEFLGELTKDVRFLTEPTEDLDLGLLLLPYSLNPLEDWRGVFGKRHKAVFMHQTVSGASADNGRILQNDNMVIFPRGLKVYSGDIHVPQIVGRVTYVGAPHPIKFGDTYPCRMLRLNTKFDVVQEIQLKPPSKLIAEISDISELDKLTVSEGDQVKVRFSMSPNNVANWPAAHEIITEWAERNGVQIVSTEVVVNGEYSAQGLENLHDPEQVLTAFAEVEGLDSAMLDAGLRILRKELKGNAPN